MEKDQLKSQLRYEEPSDQYIALELIEGGDLFDHLVRQPNSQFTEPEARKFFKQLVSAMHHCHKSNIVHRDVKLENIMLTTDK